MVIHHWNKSLDDPSSWGWNWSCFDYTPRKPTANAPANDAKPSSGSPNFPGGPHFQGQTVSFREGDEEMCFFLWWCFRWCFGVRNPRRFQVWRPDDANCMEGLQPTVPRNSIFHDDHLSEILSATEKTCGYPYGGTLTFPSRIFFCLSQGFIIDLMGVSSKSTSLGSSWSDQFHRFPTQKNDRHVFFSGGEISKSL